LAPARTGSRQPRRRGRSCSIGEVEGDPSRQSEPELLLRRSPSSHCSAHPQRSTRGATAGRRRRFVDPPPVVVDPPPTAVNSSIHRPPSSIRRPPPSICRSARGGERGRRPRLCGAGDGSDRQGRARQEGERVGEGRPPGHAARCPRQGT
jgi:hypothetical protein